jgi:hypothetical protein
MALGRGLRGRPCTFWDLHRHQSGCAKRCVHDGKKIVLVDPEHKRLLTIANQDAAKEQVGDYVEINGELDEQAQLLRIDTMKLLEKGRAMCDVPVKKKT